MAEAKAPSADDAVVVVKTEAPAAVVEPAPQTKTEGGVDASSSSIISDDDEQLLFKHFPRYFYDKREQIFPVDLNHYCADKSAVDGCNGVAAPSKDGDHRWLIYMNYYLYDGGVAQLGGAGGHKYDLEIVIVEIGIKDQSITGVFYGPHSSHEHMWIRNKDDLKEILGEGGQRPRVYISNGKHASYPISGTVLRLFGLGSDTCSGPTARVLPLLPLDEKTRRVDRIDDAFAGPKKRITRDWSTAPETRLSKVRNRRAVPPASQIKKELSKLKFW